MGRPPQTIRRDQQLNISLTGEEIASLRARAQRAGLRLTVYCRAQLLQDRLVAREIIPLRYDPRLVHQLMRVGNNLNQIARALNTQPNSIAPSDLAPALKELRVILQEAAHDSAHS
jgi:hypothetical protein